MQIRLGIGLGSVSIFRVERDKLYRCPFYSLSANISHYGSVHVHILIDGKPHMVSVLFASDYPLPGEAVQIKQGDLWINGVILGIEYLHDIELNEHLEETYSVRLETNDPIVQCKRHQIRRL